MLGIRTPGSEFPKQVRLVRANVHMAAGAPDFKPTNPLDDLATDDMCVTDEMAVFGTHP
jgi:hypothetical protein